MSEIQSQMQPPPVAMQFVVTLYFDPGNILINQPEHVAGGIKGCLDEFGQPDADVVHLPAPAHDGAQDG